MIKDYIFEDGEIIYLKRLTNKNLRNYSLFLTSTRVLITKLIKENEKPDINVDEVNRLQKEITRINADAQMFLIQKTYCKEDGTLIYSEDDLAKIDEMDCIKYNFIYEESHKLNNVYNPEEQAEKEKN